MSDIGPTSSSFTAGAATTAAASSGPLTFKRDRRVELLALNALKMTPRQVERTRIADLQRKLKAVDLDVKEKIGMPGMPGTEGGPNGRSARPMHRPLQPVRTRSESTYARVIRRVYGANPSQEMMDPADIMRQLASDMRLFRQLLKIIRKCEFTLRMMDSNREFNAYERYIQTQRLAQHYLRAERLRNDMTALFDQLQLWDENRRHFESHLTSTHGDVDHELKTLWIASARERETFTEEYLKHYVPLLQQLRVPPEWVHFIKTEMQAWNLAEQTMNYHWQPRLAHLAHMTAGANRSRLVRKARGVRGHERSTRDHGRRMRRHRARKRDGTHHEV